MNIDQYDGSECPECKSNMLDSGQPNYDGRDLEILVACCECDHSWYEVYELKSIKSA